MFNVVVGEGFYSGLVMVSDQKGFWLESLTKEGHGIEGVVRDNRGLRGLEPDVEWLEGAASNLSLVLRVVLG